MSGAPSMNVAAHEAGVVRLFAIDLTPGAISTFKTPVKGADGSTTWPLQEALGATHLDEDFIEVFHISDLDGMGLPSYLTEGVGIPADQVAQHQALLAGLTGQVLLVMSAAFGDHATSLAPKHPLRHVATLTEEGQTIAFEPLPDAGAKGSVGETPKPAKSDARIGGMVATVTLLLLFVLVGLMIWVGG